MQLQQSEPVQVDLKAQCADLPDSEYPFAIYRWQKHGVKTDESLVVVSNESKLEAVLMTMLHNAADAARPTESSSSIFEELDSRHHTKWSAARANHIAQNRELVEQRIQSLTISHQARRQLLEGQVNSASNDKIRIMKQSELSRANNDFDLRLVKLKQSAESGDIHATRVVIGTVRTEKHVTN